MFLSPWVIASLPSAKEAIEFHLKPLQDAALLPGWPGLAPALGTSAGLLWTAFLQTTTGFLRINCVFGKEGEEFYLPHLSPKRRVKKDQLRLFRHLYSEESQGSKKRKKILKKKEGGIIQKKKCSLFLSALLQRLNSQSR